MTPEEFEAKFKEGGAILNRFHQAATDAQGSRWVFWPAVVLAVIGLITVFGWFL